MKGRRAGHQVHLTEAAVAATAGITFAGQANKDRLCAGGGDTRGAGIQIPGDTTDGDFGTIIRSAIWIDEVDALRAKVGDNKLRTVGSEREATKRGVGRWAIRRGLNRAAKNLGSGVEYVHVIGGGEKDLMPRGIVENEFVEARMRKGLNLRKKLKCFRKRGRAGR